MLNHSVICSVEHFFLNLPHFTPKKGKTGMRQIQLILGYISHVMLFVRDIYKRGRLIL